MNIHESWNPIIPILYQEPLKTLNTVVLPEISSQPRKSDIFNVFSMPVNEIKVVILGQDPYPMPNTAIGRAFAVSEGTKIPASLKNIREEILISLGVESFKKNTGENWKTLQHWQEQGIFLLNTALTVETARIGSHLKYWEYFTQRVISHISVENPCIWMFWGKAAQRFIPYINQNPFHVKGYSNVTIQEIPSNVDFNYILTAPHPAAESYSGGKAGFLGCNHFKYANVILNKTKNLTLKF